MCDVQPGDHILSYVAGSVRAVSVAVTSSIDMRKPAGLADDWEDEGWLIRARYVDATPPVRRNELSEELRRAEPKDGPFKRDAGVKQGYLFPLSARFGAAFLEKFGSRIADLAGLQTNVPAEAAGTTEDFLRERIGQALRTFRGQRNVILGVQPPHVIVGTDRSPDGQPVDIVWVDEALKELRTTGEVVIHPSATSHRSSFIGAVLLTLDGATATGSPPVVRLTPQGAMSSIRPAAEAAPTPFTGALNHQVQGSQRGEQRPLRQRLLGGALEADCALCGDRYPVQYLWAAHIKKRAVCSETELRDLEHIAMLACLFGCDALFESGQISVSDKGKVILATGADPASPLGRRMARLEGRPVTSFTDESRPYFAWHRANTYRQ